MRTSSKLTNTKNYTACFILPLFIIGCGVAKKEEKNRASYGEFKSIVISTKNVITGSEQKSIHFFFEMDCDNINYNHKFELKNAKDSYIDIPYNTTCRLSIEKFKLGEEEFTNDATYTGSEKQLTTRSQNKSNVTIIPSSSYFLYLQNKSSAFLSIEKVDKGLIFYISEFKDRYNSGTSSALTDNDKIKIADIQTFQNLDLSNLKHQSWRGIVSADKANYWQAFDTSNPEFLNHCKIHINDKDPTKLNLASTIQINHLEKAFAESKQNCKDFPYFIDYEQAETAYKNSSLSSTFSVNYNEYINKEVFLVFKKASPTNTNVIQYGLLKIDSKEITDSSINKSVYKKMLKAVKENFELITTANLKSAKQEIILQTKILGYIKNSYAGAKDSPEHKETPKLIQDYEAELNELKKKVDEFEKTLPST